eukprot:11756805-Alexandrium_andersonii.AAC.1
MLRGPPSELDWAAVEALRPLQVRAAWGLAGDELVEEVGALEGLRKPSAGPSRCPRWRAGARRPEPEPSP